MNLKQCYALLEIQPDAGDEEIRRAYRDLVIVWHPDRHQQNPRLKEKATARLQALNIAFETLTAHRQARAEKQAATVTPPGTRPAARSATPAHAPGRKRPAAVWLLLLAGVCVTALVIQSRWPALVNTVQRLLPAAFFDRLPGRAQPQGADESHRLAGRLTAARLDADQVAQLQRSLNLMGYDCGPTDGSLGQKTMRAALLFAGDFKVALDDRFVGRLLAEANRQAAVARVHAEWPATVRSPALNAWIDTQTVAAPAVCRQVLASGSAEQLINLADAYRFDRARPQPEALPQSGILKKRFYKGLAPLKINTRNEGRHFFIKLLALPQRTEAVSIFIRSGDRVALRMPLGAYDLKYAVGRNWYGSRWLFGSDTVYSRLDSPVHFTLSGHEIAGCTIDLSLDPLPLKAKNREYAFDF